jgi:hypothetical protein
MLENMRERALLQEATDAMDEAQAGAIAAIGLRGNEARITMTAAARIVRNRRWATIVQNARRYSQALRPTPDELRLALILAVKGRTYGDD